MTAINGVSNIPTGFTQTGAAVTGANGVAGAAGNAAGATGATDAISQLLSLLGLGSIPGAGAAALKANTTKMLAALYQPNATDSVPPVKVRKADDSDYYSALGYYDA